MMAEPPFFSSQNSQYETHQIILDQENLASSPLAAKDGTASVSRSGKLKRPPTVTPKRFTKFFTPRNSLSSQGSRRSKASRQLQDITRNGANRRINLSLKDHLLNQTEHCDGFPRPTKRRKHSFDLPSSPPAQSSPLKHVHFDEAPGHILLESVHSPIAHDEHDLPELLGSLNPFPIPIRRMRHDGHSRRILQRSFGGYDAIGRGWKGTDHCADWRTQTSKYVSKPNDRHEFCRGIIPFTVTSCNTNSLVAIGEEEGRVRLIDSAATADFTKPYVTFQPHSNSVMDIAFNSDDFLLATASGDQTCRITDMHTQQSVIILSGHRSSVKQVRFQPNSDNLLTSSSRDGTVLVWDLRCPQQGSVLNLRTSFARAVTADGDVEPSLRYSSGTLPVGDAHWVTKGTTTSSSRILNSRDTPVSVTAIQHLGNGREHMLLTATELNSSLRLWDLRNACRRQAPMPLSVTPLPESHSKSRNFGVNSLAMSGDGARLYALSRDATVYVYATNHLVSGAPPEMFVPPGRRRNREEQAALGPLYGFQHSQLGSGSFYVKASVRPARGDKSEMLAVGGPKNCAVLFPTDEQYLKRPELQAEAQDQYTDDDDTELPTLPVAMSIPASTPESRFPIYKNGTALVGAHECEVTGVQWTHDGELITLSDDYTARCWREDASKAGFLRQYGEQSGGRWGHGWAEMEPDWDAISDE